MKKTFGSLFVFVFAFSFIGCDSSTKTVDQMTIPSLSEQTFSLLTETRTTQYFTKEAVPEKDVRLIIEAGLNATSAMNMQPWHFSAIIGNDKVQEFASSMTPTFPQGGPAGPPQGMPTSQYPKAGFKDAPTAIVISCTSGQNFSEFSTGLACENMFVAAASMGYGVKIVVGGVAAINTPSTKSSLGIPEEMDAVAILLIGKENAEMMSLDGITGPTTRKSFNEVATIVK